MNNTPHGMLHPNFLKESLEPPVTF